ncbi:MAG TPA: TetR/AcrR family transcriptional regulator [Streptosporangiaceae bacterium]|nr:TetR/AcrR family transcriptional regulator [Streptosporangiaceae bacterium]
MSSQVSVAPRARRTQADRSAATRDALVAAARPLFAAHGFAEVPTDAIAAAAGVTRGALYHQFADKTALFEAVLTAVEADIARRLAKEAEAAGLTDPIEVMRHAIRTWLNICVEPDILRIALIDGPSVLGWRHWREVCQLHVFGLVRALVVQGIELGRIRPQPVMPLSHALMGASDEAALYVAEATDRARARAEMTEILDQFIQGLAA